MHTSIQMIFCLCQGLVGTLHTKGALVIVNISLLLPWAEIAPRQSSFLWPWVISIFNLSQIAMISRADSRTHAKADMHVHAHKPRTWPAVSLQGRGGAFSLKHTSLCVFSLSAGWNKPIVSKNVKQKFSFHEPRTWDNWSHMGPPVSFQPSREGNRFSVSYIYH